MIVLALLASAQISGTVRYENREYNAAGFTGGTQFIPVRRALVELVNPTTGNSWFGFTNDNGAYTVLPTDAGVFGVFLRVYASNTSGPVYNAEVRNNVSANAVYTSVSATVARTLPADALPINLDVPAASTAAEAFNIFDAAVWSFDYVLARDTAGGLAALSPLPRVVLYWEPGATAGTFFDPPTNRLFLRGLAADDDGWDDDIVLHELGHFISVNWGRDDSPGGFHSITDQLDPRLAWSEGWAHYFSSAVRAFANTIKPGQPGPPTAYVDPWTQVDIFSVGNSFFDLEAPSFSADTITDRNEVAVGAGLWDILDTVNEGGFDTLGGAAKEIDTWQILRVQIPGFSNITLEDFFKGWLIDSPGDALSVSGTSAAAGIFKDRLTRFYVDPSEPNDGSGTAVALGAVPPTGLLLERTFFDAGTPLGTGDEDWFSFTLAAPGFLRVQTRNLGDAADTLVELYNGALALQDFNDNRSGTDVSSLIERSVPAGIYFVRVRPATGSVAEFGTYDLQVEIATNLPPSVTLSADVTGGAAPLGVRFTASAVDSDGLVSRWEWDFDGDGLFEFSSIEGGDVTHRFAQPGSHPATLRVTDNGGATALASITVSVSSPSGSVIVTESVGGATQPVTVTLGAIVSGLTPKAYEWDFDGDGTVDATLTGAATVTHTYALAGGYSPRLWITDVDGVRHEAAGDPITVSPAGIPAVGLGAVPVTGSVPLPVTFTATAGLTSYEWDFDGDGAVDEVGSANVVTHRYVRVGNYTARVVGINALGQGAKGTVAVSVTQSSATGGWIVSPEPGNTIDGASVTLVVEMRPARVNKLVLFQHKQDAAPFGPFTNIGGLFTETGAEARQAFNLSGVANLDTRDVRALIDVGTSSGDENVPNVTRSLAAPLIRENAPGGLRQRDQTVTVMRTAWMPTLDRADLLVPARSSSSPTDIGVRWRSLGDAGGSFEHPTRLRVGDLWEMTVTSGTGTFGNAVWIELPYADIDGDENVDGSAAGDVNALEILRWNGSAWERTFESDVVRSERQVRMRTSRTGLYAVFGGALTGSAAASGSAATAFEDGSAGSRGKFSECSAAPAAGGGATVPWAVLALAATLVTLRRRP